ncbi:TolC family protein [Spirosoma sp. BT702]|uniref:TolC family protein n=1 Tax=Spirosoma profusum TaxID=2771354 RepID=A0A927AVP8_9BACT|nr:TolC family protein [Spirosoma profusum]MBD2705269.1 TolC family protein [Spirosoma profusum]
MKNKLFISLFWLAIGLVHAQPQPIQLPDDLRVLIQQANTNYPVLKQQQEQIRAGELRTDIARTAMKPNVSGTALYQYLNPVAQATLPVDGVNRTLQFQPNHNVNANIGVGQTIYDWGRTHASVQQAADNVQVLRRSLEISQQNLAYQVAAAYYGIGFLQRSLSVQDSVIHTAGANVQLLATRLQNGDALQYDVLTQQVRVKVAQNRKIEIQNQLERQLALLTYLTGNPSPDVSGAVKQFNLETAGNNVTMQPFVLANDAQTALAGNKDVQLAQDRVRQAETDIVVNNLAGRPNLSFSGSAGFRNGYLPEINTPKFNIAAGVSLAVPIYSGKRYQLQSQAAQLNLNASRYAVENANAQVRQSIAQLNADIRSNLTRLANLETQVLQSKKALEIANARLRNGVITNVELQSAETGVEEAELGRLNFQYQLLLNQLELKRLLGDTLVGQ